MGIEHFSRTDAVEYGAGRPALLITDPHLSVGQTQELIEQAGLRMVGTCAVGEAVERLDRQAALDLVWAECGGNWPGDALIQRLASLADRGTAVIVSIVARLIDEAVAALPAANVQILVDPDPLDRAAALSLAIAESNAPARVSDIGRDNAVRLRQLSDEVGRIAASLARLSSVPEQADRPALVARDFGKVPELDGEQVRAVIRARRMRSRFFDEGLFADPAWDMLLDLLQAEIAQHRVPVSSLCIAAAVPATTALRWIRTMTDAGLFVRRADPHDGRRIFVELSANASAAMRRYFAEAGEAAGL